MLDDIYQELIIDHGTEPRNVRSLRAPTHRAEGINPLCGDAITLELTLQESIIEDIAFQGQGCAICMASCSLMTECFKLKSIQEAKGLYNQFHGMLTDPNAPIVTDPKLKALAGVKTFPTRVKCATLAWHTFDHALHQQNDAATTE